MNRTINSERVGCKDVFNAFLVENAFFEGKLEIPVIEPTYWKPNKLIPFSEAVSCKDYNQWIHFYEDDYKFERVWKNPKAYLEMFKRFNGVILADFSLYEDMPIVMQAWNIYRSRAIGSWLQYNGIRIIPNIRFGSEETYDFCCDGISPKSTIAIGSHGNMKHKEDRQAFEKGLDYVVRKLAPSVIVVYGAAPDSIFKKYREMGITIICFESAYSAAHKGGE